MNPAFPVLSIYSKGEGHQPIFRKVAIIRGGPPGWESCEILAWDALLTVRVHVFTACSTPTLATRPKNATVGYTEENAILKRIAPNCIVSSGVGLRRCRRINGGTAWCPAIMNPGSGTRNASPPRPSMTRTRRTYHSFCSDRFFAV